MLGGGWSRSRSAPLQMRLTPLFCWVWFCTFCTPLPLFRPAPSRIRRDSVRKRAAPGASPRAGVPRS